jgi:hypothetical protein
VTGELGVPILRPVLLDLGEPGGFDLGSWANHIRSVDAKHTDVWELPLLGQIAPAPAVLIRPDGHADWAGDLADPELPRAPTTWFGPGDPGLSTAQAFGMTSPRFEPSREVRTWRSD